MDARSERDVMAAEQAAREARRQEIMGKIRILEQEITECEDLAQEFESLRGQVSAELSGLSAFQNMELEPNRSIFSGITAGAAVQGITGVKSSVGGIVGKVCEAESEIGTQIGMLRSYIMELKSRISTLKASI